MLTTELIKRYIWVVEVLMRRKQVTLEELNREWLFSPSLYHLAEKMNRKSWYKVFYEIGSIWGILIVSKRAGRYSYWYILNPEIFYEREVQTWMIRALTHRNLIEECVGLYNRVDLEDFPSENGRLKPIVLAMRKGRKIEVTYQRYGHSEPKQYVVEPYFIKTYNHRFYLLCHNEEDRYFPLSFDRIVDIRETDIPFTFPVEINAKKFFAGYFGVMIPAQKLKTLRIVVRAKGDARYYLFDTPLHNTQELIEETEDYADFAVFLKPTEDFFGAVLQQGERLEIMSPVSVRNHIKRRLKKALLPYLNV